MARQNKLNNVLVLEIGFKLDFECTLWRKTGNALIWHTKMLLLEKGSFWHVFFSIISNFFRFFEKIWKKIELFPPFIFFTKRLDSDCYKLKIVENNSKIKVKFQYVQNSLVDGWSCLKCKLRRVFTFSIVIIHHIFVVV